MTDTLLRAILIASLFACMAGCRSSTPVEGPGDSPQGELAAAGLATTRAAEVVGASVGEIKSTAVAIGQSTQAIGELANAGKAATPAGSLNSMGWNAVIEEVRRLWQSKGKLDQTAVRLQDATGRIADASAAIKNATAIDLKEARECRDRIASEKKRADHAEAACAKENRTQLIVIRGGCIVGIVVGIGLGAFFFKYGLTAVAYGCFFGAVGCVAGLAVTFVLLELTDLIRWVFIGAAGLAFAVLIIWIVKNQKTIFAHKAALKEAVITPDPNSLSTATKQLAELPEGPLTTTAALVNPAPTVEVLSVTTPEAPTP